MELWDIYDKNKVRTGRTMKRNDWILKDDEYHLSVLGVVTRPDGKYLITKRVMTKHWAPEGGYVFSYHRENTGTGDNYFVDIYKFCLDFDESDVKMQEEEADGFMIATLDEIKAFAEQGIFLHYDSIKRVFE